MLEVPLKTRRRLGADWWPPRGKSCGAVRTVDSQLGGAKMGRGATRDRPLLLAPPPLALLSASAAAAPLPDCARTTCRAKQRACDAAQRHPRRCARPKHSAWGNESRTPTAAAPSSAPGARPPPPAGPPCYYCAWAGRRSLQAFQEVAEECGRVSGRGLDAAHVLEGAADSHGGLIAWGSETCTIEATYLHCTRRLAPGALAAWRLSAAAACAWSAWSGYKKGVASI